MDTFWRAWQNLPEHINPVFVKIGALEIRYYGIMYALAFVVCYSLVTRRVKKESFPYTNSLIQDYFIWAILASIIGGRIGYVLMYDLRYFMDNPLRIMFPFDFTDGFHFTGISGMSYHGGLIAIIAVSIVFCAKNKMNFWDAADLFCPVIPLGYMFGRIGNFLNQELFGRITNMPWGMYFANSPTRVLRHPSQVYEAFFEGLALFVILWTVRKKKIFKHRLLAVYLIGYAVTRFFIEFVREPDSQLGLIAASLTLGQVLCAGMFASGVMLLFVKKHPTT
jgi:phosphatidylglycerol:prolipoprotein diacylglycerol transferase